MKPPGTGPGLTPRTSNNRALTAAIQDEIARADRTSGPDATGAKQSPSGDRP